ncbi:hypothetical protein A5819_002419 [Enterococcus sp. 7E2_DIV0204]|uniref:hypothetical protein n=1 Tax=unclassified Enterococcus TaxID=2608891 RepID=UPI000A34E92F|nr:MULTISPECIES: hypothetical protein [unclassified Enterococcus]OTN89921.1 hypothetical protein A5819_002419 [Enterococcus sp. 7E2_DIV0204]OTP52377.1 hypothetical protein A5884_001578 [Enterococcus sp. 7D2_DIV0200]
MKENKENIEHDLEYYQSGIRQLYLKTYQKYLLILLAVMLGTAIGIGATESIVRWLLIAVFLIEAGIVVYLFRYLRAETFEAYFQQIKEQLPNEFQKMTSIEIQEDDQAYYFSDDQALFVKLKKKNTRNFPSKIRQYTLLVGFTGEINKNGLEQPLQFFYYDITQIKHSANYKKEILKNTNFIAKRKKRRIKTTILTLILLVVLGTLVYFGAKTYLQDVGRTLYEKRVKGEDEDNIGQETQVRISELAITNENETLKIQLPKRFHEEKGELSSADEVKGLASKAFSSPTLYVSILMSQVSNATSLSEFVGQVLEDDGKINDKKTNESLHPDLFKNEYIITTKTSKNGQPDSSNYTTYFFETGHNYGWIMCEITATSQTDDLDLAQQVQEILGSIELDTKGTVI